MTATEQNAFDVAAAKDRCKRHRKRILDMTQYVTALHVGGAFSSTEIVDCIYYNLMRPGSNGNPVGDDAPDTFLMSKGHGYMIQVMLLVDLGILTEEHLRGYCTPHGILGVHPDYGNPGIEASTGSLGHGMGMALGMAYAEKTRGTNGTIYTVMSDGEVQEGSTWEATLMASSLGVSNLVAFIDNNNMQSATFTTDTHPSFYPVVEKYEAFGWEAVEVDGHDSEAIFNAVQSRSGDKPLLVNCKTTKGKGVSYMESVPMWHYRSPDPEEYKQAIREIDEAN
ncbi:MAG: transketolase [Pseudomonadota bacterium]